VTEVPFFAKAKANAQPAIPAPIINTSLDFTTCLLSYNKFSNFNPLSLYYLSMRTQYALFQSHLDLAHCYWQNLLSSGEIVIDATCGNGHDTLKLAQLTLVSGSGKLYACDIQATAIETTRHYLLTHLSPQQFNRIEFVLGCHSQFPPSLHPGTVKLIVYNLGYLPGSQKQLTTTVATTWQSITQAQELITPGGAISITCYPGHPEGAAEEEALLDYLSQLSPSQWSCCHHRWINRRQAPSLLLLQKAKEKP
jgi:hypothetical protein